MKEGTRGSFSFIEPMNALPVQKLPEGDWLYEVKLDGYRALVFKDGKDVRLVSRNQKDFHYPRLLDSFKKLPAERVILDGELPRWMKKAALRTSRSRYFKSSGGAPLVYYVFGVLFLEGRDLRKQPSAPGGNCRPSELPIGVL